MAFSSRGRATSYALALFPILAAAMLGARAE
jgi:hypothetical protein